MAVQDTSPAAKKRYYELLAAKSPVERLQIAVRLSRVVRELAESAIRSEVPTASERTVRRMLADRLYGRDVATRLFPVEPSDAVPTGE